MKALFRVLLFVLPTLLFTQCEWFGEDEPDHDPTDLVNIPDQVFLDALIEEGVDTNGDSLINYSEAEAITTLVVGDNWGRGIEDMTGIEAFVNLDSLSCGGNYLNVLDLNQCTKLKYLDACGYNEIIGGGLASPTLVSLDISKCTELEYLDCRVNKLSDLDLGNNTKLKELYCGANLLEYIDLSNNTLLEYLGCGYNLLESLDLSKNTLLEYLRCGGNRMTSLDISTNTSLKTFIINDDSLLSKVCVWTMPFPPDGVTVVIDNSPYVYFTTDCSQ